MELSRLLQELIQAARKAGITVRSEPFDPKLSNEKSKWRGGLCVVKGERIILVDDRAPLVDRVATVAAALASVDLEHVFLPPIVRATIGAYQKESLDRPAPNAKSFLGPVRAKRRNRDRDA